MARLPDDARRLLDGANYGHLATLMPDGAPKVDPVWVGHEDEFVVVTTDHRSIKARNVARDGRVGLSVVAFDNPYEQVLIRGTVVDVRPDDDLRVLDVLAHKYTGASFPRRNWSQRAILMIEPTLVRYYVSSLRDVRVAGPTAAGVRQRDEGVDE